VRRAAACAAVRAGGGALTLRCAAPRSRWDADTGTAVLTRGVAAGAEVMNCYGAKSSGSLLLHFGFAPWRNDADTVVLRVAATFPATDAGAGAAAALRARGRKQHLFAQLADGRMALPCTLRAAQPLPPRLLAAARVCCMTGAEAAAAGADAAPALAGPVSAANEAAARECVPPSSRLCLPSADTRAELRALLLSLRRYIASLLQRRVAALLGGQSRDAWAARVAAARAADALRCGRRGDEVAVTPAGAAVAYRDSLLQVLLAALAAATAT
jgi:hypothetical protein